MPNWDRSIDLFVNVGTSPAFVLLASRTSVEPAERPVLVSGDVHKLRLWLLKPGAEGTAPTVLSIAAGEQIIFAGKATVTGSLLFSASAFLEVNDADGLHYEATLDLTPAALTTALGDDPSIAVICDVEVQNAANTLRRSRQFSVRVNRGVYSGEADPAPAAPLYPAPGALLTTGADTASIKRGTLNLVAGQYDAIAIAFATAFAAAPSTVHVWLMKKAGAPIITAHENHDTITAAGFTVDLAAAIPDDAAAGDYKLAWLAIL